MVKPPIDYFSSPGIQQGECHVLVLARFTVSRRNTVMEGWFESVSKFLTTKAFDTNMLKRKETIR
jgi:hypothetical protein